MVRGRTTVSKTKTVVPSYVKTIEKLMDAANWKQGNTAEVIQLRNFLKRQKGFGNIRKWELNWHYDEYANVKVLTEVVFTDYTGKEHKFG